MQQSSWFPGQHRSVSRDATKKLSVGELHLLTIIRLRNYIYTREHELLNPLLSAPCQHCSPHGDTTPRIAGLRQACRISGSCLGKYMSISQLGSLAASRVVASWDWDLGTMTCRCPVFELSWPRNQFDEIASMYIIPYTARGLVLSYKIRRRPSLTFIYRSCLHP